jgi:hypothetical protein
MKRMAFLAMALAAAGCTVDSGRDDRRGFYDNGYNNGPYVQQPVYGPDGYPVQGGYGQPGYVQGGGYGPGGGYAQGGYGQGYPQDRYPQDGYREPRGGGQRPAPVPQVQVNQRLVQAGDNLVASIDQYLQSVASFNNPDLTQMWQILGTMRGSADQFRTAARSGQSGAMLRGAAQDLLARFNAANNVYARLTQTNRGFTSELFQRFAEATARVVEYSK